RSRRGSSILLFEHDAYGLSGGQTIVRVQDAPYAIFCQGHRCAAPASAQAPTPRPAHQRRLPELMPPKEPFKPLTEQVNSHKKKPESGTQPNSGFPILQPPFRSPNTSTPEQQKPYSSP